MCIRDRVYEAWIQEHPFDDGQGAWASEPWFQKEMPVSLELAKKARETSNKALVVIGRTAGEDKDYAAVEGSYYLTKEEKQLLETVAEVFEDCLLYTSRPLAKIWKIWKETTSLSGIWDIYIIMDWSGNR